jgi:hypothetical protein
MTAADARRRRTETSKVTATLLTFTAVPKHSLDERSSVPIFPYRPLGGCSLS